MKKTAIITGGTKGIGLGIANSLLENGYNVVITSRSEESAKRIASTLAEKHGNSVHGIGCDVRNYDSQEDCVNRTIAKYGSVDIMIANAGVGHFASIEDLSIEKWNATIDTNLTGVFYSTKASIEALKKSEGYLITIASLAGTNFFQKGSAYNASKFGLVGFTQSVMLDLRQYGIKVTTIMPGSVSTYFNGHTPSEEDSWKIQPEDLGQIVVDLLKMNSRTLPSKIEVRPSIPGGKK
ncbi:MAG: 3-oxoacyl-[acyl-carrier protein] reductase [Saprospiraceae bacterium]|jgi:3-oxoacyl-[acyl-carrier protein] reductase